MSSKLTWSSKTVIDLNLQWWNLVLIYTPLNSEVFGRSCGVDNLVAMDWVGCRIEPRTLHLFGKDFFLWLSQCNELDWTSTRFFDFNCNWIKYPLPHWTLSTRRVEVSLGSSSPKIWGLHSEEAYTIPFKSHFLGNKHTWKILFGWWIRLELRCCWSFWQKQGWEFPPGRSWGKDLNNQSVNQPMPCNNRNAFLVIGIRNEQQECKREELLILEKVYDFSSIAETKNIR